MHLIILSICVSTAEEEVEARKRIGANAKLTVSQEIRDTQPGQKFELFGVMALIPPSPLRIVKMTPTQFKGIGCAKMVLMSAAHLFTHGRACSVRDIENTSAIEMSGCFTDTSMFCLLLYPI